MGNIFRMYEEIKKAADSFTRKFCPHLHVVP